MGNVFSDAGDWGKRAYSKGKEALFGDDAIFGPETPSPAEQAKAALILRMLGREEQLWPEMQELLKTLPGMAEEAYAADTGELSRLYPSIMGDITSYNLDPQAEQFLSNLRNEQVGELGGEVDRMIGSRVANLAQRGVTSSTTAEGSMGEVGRAIQPALSKINQDYWNARITLPGQNAAQRWNLASGYSANQGEALRRKFNTMYGPKAQMWGAMVGAGDMKATPEDKWAGTERLLKMSEQASKGIMAGMGGV